MIFKVKKSKYLILIVIFIVVLFIIQKQKNNHVYKKIIIGNIIVKTEIAESSAKKQKGLSDRNFLRKNSGMLFVFSKPDFYSFWMKNMKFPIDIIWIDDNFRIISIDKNVTPDTFPKKFISQLPAKYVLEVSGGWTDKNKIKEGVIIKVKP